jgi:hypothetical protein
MSNNTDNRTATQRIEDLEKVVTMLYQATAQLDGAVKALGGLQGDMVLVKDALKLLNKKTEATIQVAKAETGISVESVTALVTEMNVTDLKAQVAGYLANGHLAPADEVADNSYVVAEETNADGTLANPRIQFRVDTLDKDTAAALKGKKVGDTASFGGDKFGAKILEIYTLTEPKAADSAEPAAETPAATETAPADAAPAASTEAAPSAAPTGPSNDNFTSPPAETPVETFVASDATTLATASNQ